MTYNPSAPTAEEIKELASSGELQDYWGGFDTAEELEDCLKGDYIAKFNFTNSSPGYYGDLFLIQSGDLANDIPVTRLFRGKDGQLVILR